MESIVDLAPDLVVGGRYRLIESLAQGGTASVWRARDERLERDVAVKVLRDEGIDPELRRRAEREAQVLAGLSHRNLVRVYDSGVDDGRPYLVMELLEGSTLHRIVAERGRLGVEEATNLVADVADGLGVAHRAGVVHRDVKPGNIMCHEEVPTLVDFGIARRTDATTMTRGLVLGTASYLAPEQAQGLPLTPAADVYSLGCVLHELLTGTPPFQGDGPVAIAFKHVNDAPEAPSTLEPSIPAALDAVILRCLAKDPTARPADGAALAAELRRALSPDAESTVAMAPIAVAGPATEVLPAAPLAATGATTAAPAVVAPLPAAGLARGGVPWRIIAAVVVAALLLALLWGALAGDDTTTVPEIIGVDTATALDELDDAGLRADVFEVDSDQPAGTVVMTGPGPGLEAEPGATVKVAVSNGAAVPTPTTTTPPPPAETGDGDDDGDEGGGRGEGRGKKKDDD